MDFKKPIQQKINLKQKAFTLIEVIISLALFTSISMSLTQVINQATRSQEQVEALVKKSRILKNTSYLIQKDIKNSLRTTNSFHWAYNSYKRCLLNKVGSSEFLEEPYMNIEDQIFLHNSQPFPLMQMEGESDSLFLAQVSPKGVLQKIEYSLESCLDEEESVNCLVRKTYEIIDDINLASEDTEERVPLIKNIAEINFYYYDSVTKDWVQQFERQNKNSFSLRSLERSEYFPFPLPMALKLELKMDDDSNIKINIPIEQSFLSEKITMMNTFNPQGVYCLPPGYQSPSPQETESPPNPSPTSSFRPYSLNSFLISWRF